MRLQKIGSDDIVEIELASGADGQCEVRIDGRVLQVEVQRLPDGSALLLFEGRKIRVAALRDKDKLVVAAGPVSHEFMPVASGRNNSRHGIFSPQLISPMPGKILKVLVAEGARVEAGAPLLVLEAMKMETTLFAEGPAIIRRVLAAPGSMVEGGAVLIEFTPPSP